MRLSPRGFGSTKKRTVIDLGIQKNIGELELWKNEQLLTRGEKKGLRRKKHFWLRCRGVQWHDPFVFVAFKNV